MTDFDTSDRDVTRAIRSWLHEDRHEDASRIAGAVLDQVDTTRQRRSWWPARRSSDMNGFAKFLVATAAVVAVLFVGAQLIGPPSGGVGSQATPTPEPTASPEPSTSSPPSTPPLTESFTSPLHGFSVSYPEGWIAEAATEPWTDGTHHPDFTDTFADDLYDPVLTDHLDLAFASQPLGDSTPDEWVAEQMAGNDCSATEPIAVDGATGLIGGRRLDMVAVTAAGRGYWIILRTSDDVPSAVAAYDRAWFEEVLATVQLQPEDAVDVAPSAAP